ncbi:hypothetical protein BFJ67_g18114 [Fusarium oxysporum f. sp. cepae]|nr:hypothetical protein BFJ67_g18114 [Fusarium oxysporum f. sp. cepae]
MDEPGPTVIERFMIVVAVAEHPSGHFGSLRYLIYVDVAESSVPKIDIQALL